MQKIYNRIDEDFMSLNEANDLLFEIRNAVIKTEVSFNDDINSLCEELNSEDVYGCGTSFYVVDEDITHSELLKIINS